MPLSTYPGWEDKNGNLEASFQQKVGNSGSQGPGGSGTFTNEIIAVANDSTGAYDIYYNNKSALGISFGRTLIYSYSPSESKNKGITIKDQDLYSRIYQGEDGTKQLNNINKSVKDGVIRNLQLNATDPIVQQNLAKIKQTKGYLSLGSNTQVAPDAGDANDGGGSLPSGGTQPVNPGGSTDPNEENTGDDIKPKESFDPVDFNNVRNKGGLNFTEGGKEFRYPLRTNVSKFGYDFMRFTSFRYVHAGLSFSDNKLTGSSDIETRLGQESLVTTILPMLPGISESNSISWGGDKANPLQLIAGKLAMGLIESGANLDFGAVKEVFQATGTEITKALEDDNTRAAIVAYFAGQAVGANVFTRATGIVVNPNLELLFNGPTLRTFNYNFKLTPRDENEAKEVRNIIKSFKQNSLPQRSESNLFLLTPNVYKLEYIYGGDSENQKEVPHPFLNKIKPCALTSFNVNYAPEGSYMTFRGLPSMTCYEINMQFSEIQPIYANDINMKDESMGF